MSLLELIDISPYDWSSVFTALICGAIIGVERQFRGKPVGIRTSTLIILGTYLFLKTTLLLQGPGIDESRVIGQIVTGIGFLGAGVMLARDGAVVGVTSAAVIWVLAALGVVVSLDHLTTAIKLSVLVVMILLGVDLLERHTRAFGRGVHTRVVQYSDRHRRKHDSNN
ncbi:MAG: putative Mg2+ transporter-C (MgtC) family protein [Candidatus Azotimanducaceae bacterium]|jgi:putative Mg2+ transporter-C (MgtC) family protein